MDLLIATIFIFVLRLADQSLGTMRTLLVNKNRPVYAAFLGFIESAIWIIAVSQVIKDINDHYFGVINDNLMEITIDTPLDIAGFQFNIIGTVLDGGSGGIAADYDFIINLY